MSDVCSATGSYLCVVCSNLCGCARSDADEDNDHNAAAHAASSSTHRRSNSGVARGTTTTATATGGEALRSRSRHFAPLAFDVVLPANAVTTTTPPLLQPVVSRAAATTTAASAAHGDDVSLVRDGRRVTTPSQPATRALHTPSAFAASHEQQQQQRQQDGASVTPATPLSPPLPLVATTATTTTTAAGGGGGGAAAATTDAAAAAAAADETSNALSFTNSFADVNETAVTAFLRGIAQLSTSHNFDDALQHSILSATLQHPSALMHLLKTSSDGAAPLLGVVNDDDDDHDDDDDGGGGDGSSSVAHAHACMTAEAAEYIARGGPASERLQRLCEVEYATREQLTAAGVFYSQLLHMAAARIVPTLRTRRAHGVTDAGTTTAAAAIADHDEPTRPVAAVSLNGGGGDATDAGGAAAAVAALRASLSTLTPRLPTIATTPPPPPPSLQQQQQRQQERPVLVIHAHDLRLESPRSLSLSQSLESAVPLLSRTARSPITSPQLLSFSLAPPHHPTTPASATMLTPTAGDARDNGGDDDSDDNDNGHAASDAAKGGHTAATAAAAATPTRVPVAAAAAGTTPHKRATTTTTTATASPSPNKPLAVAAATAATSAPPPSRPSPPHDDGASEALSMSLPSSAAVPRAQTPPTPPQQSPPPQQQQSQPTRAQAAAHGAAVEHLEMLALNCREVACTGRVSAVVESATWDFLAKESHVHALNRGDCVFRFLCMPATALDEESLELIDTFINVSAFADEAAQNNVPVVHIRDVDARQRYIVIMVKTMYMLPHVRIADVTAPLVASYDYQRACQPGSNKVEQTDASDTFRITSTIIKYIFSITVQFKVSEVTSPALLQSFKRVDGLVPARALVLERTKRHIYNTDATAKVRSMLLYYPVNGGVLVDNQTIVLNTSLPTIASKILNTFGAQGASQSADTARLTRQYFAKRNGVL